MADDILSFQGLKAETLLKTLIEEKGIPRADAGIMVSSWLFENFRTIPHRFDYATPFDAVDAHCVSAFQRTFHHVDWVDGENVVQAEETTLEEGFNRRFHRIENDLDALGAEVGKVFACLADMRRSVRTLLDEVRAELNRLNQAMNQGRVERGPAAAKEAPPFGELLEANTFMGKTRFGDKDVTLWKTAHGLMMLPSVASFGVDPVDDVRVRRAGEIGFVAKEDPQVRDAFAGGPRTKKEMVDAFGDVVGPSGMKVREMLAIVPDDTRFNSADEMVHVVADREAAALRTTEGAGAAIANAFGVERDVGTVADAKVERFETIPADARTAMVGAGVDTMDKLAGANADDLANRLRTAGVANVSPGRVASWAAVARTLKNVR